MEQTDGRTDGRTPDRYTDPAPHTMRVVSLTVLMKNDQILSKQLMLTWSYFRSPHRQLLLASPI